MPRQAQYLWGGEFIVKDINCHYKNVTFRQSQSGRHSLSGSQTVNSDSQGQPFRLGSDKSTVDYTGDFGEIKTFKFDKVIFAVKYNTNCGHNILRLITRIYISYANIEVFLNF